MRKVQDLFDETDKEYYYYNMNRGVEQPGSSLGS